MLMAAWEKNGGHMPTSNQVLREMKTTVSNFQGFRFCFARREANKAVHAGARSALSINSLVVTFEQIPFIVNGIKA
jgi:hypothetical protein